MKTVVFREKKVVALASSYVCALLTGKRAAALMRKLGLRGVPSYAVLKPTGEQIESFTGATDALKITTMMQEPLESLVEQAAERLAAARKLASAGQHLRAYQAFAVLAARLTWSEPSQAAAKAMAAMREDKAVWPQIELALAEQKARALRSKADSIWSNRSPLPH